MLRIWVLTVFTETDSSLAVSGLERFVGRYRSTRSSLGLAAPLTVRAHTAGAGETCRGQRWRAGQRAGDAAGTGTGHQRARRAPHGEPPLFPRLSIMYPRRWCGRGLLLRPFLTRRDSHGTGQPARKGSLVGLAADRRGKESDLLDYTTTPTMRAPPRSSTTRFASDTRRPAGSCCGITTRPGRG